MTRLLILHLALVGALIALVTMTPAVSGAAIVVPGADAAALAKAGSGVGKMDHAKDDGVTHVDRARHAVGGDEFHAKESFTKDDRKSRSGHVKVGSDGGNNLADRIKAGILKAGSVVAGV